MSCSPTTFLPSSGAKIRIPSAKPVPRQHSVANDRAFLILVPFQGEARPHGKALLAGLIMLGAVGLWLASPSCPPTSPCSASLWPGTPTTHRYSPSRPLSVPPLS